jgi:hypothetical protein
MDRTTTIAASEWTESSGMINLKLMERPQKRRKGGERGNQDRNTLCGLDAQLHDGLFPAV